MGQENYHRANLRMARDLADEYIERGLDEMSVPHALLIVAAAVLVGAYFVSHSIDNWSAGSE